MRKLFVLPILALTAACSAPYVSKAYLFQKTTYQVCKSMSLERLYYQIAQGDLVLTGSSFSPGMDTAAAELRERGFSEKEITYIRRGHTYNGMQESAETCAFAPTR
jgi:hypothetical protein